MIARSDRWPGQADRLGHGTTAVSKPVHYIDSLQLTIGDIVSPLWIGTILVAANPRRVLPA